MGYLAGVELSNYPRPAAATLMALPHDVDVKALTRLATLYDVLFAVNAATADAVLAAL